MPRGADPFASPPPMTTSGAEAEPSRWRASAYTIAAVVLLGIAATIAFVFAPGEPAPTFSIVTSPPGADVSIDGRAVGMTPLIIAEGLEVGHAYQIAVTRRGYGPRSLVLQAQPGPVEQQVVLTGLPATLHVDTAPPGGQVTIGGTPRGVAPVDASGFLVGAHVEVRASLPGHGLPVVQSVELDETTSLTITIP